MQMKSAVELRAKLQKIDRIYWTDYRISQHLGLSQSQWKQLLTQTKNPSGKTLMGIIDLAVDHGGFKQGEILDKVRADLSKLPKIERKKRSIAGA